MPRSGEAITRGDIPEAEPDMIRIGIDVSYDKATDMIHLAHVNGLEEARNAEEISSMALYTCQHYYAILNKALRDPNRDIALVPHVEYLWLFMHAFRKSPRFTKGRQVFRGVKGE